MLISAPNLEASDEGALKLATPRINNDISETTNHNIITDNQTITVSHTQDKSVTNLMSVSLTVVTAQNEIAIDNLPEHDILLPAKESGKLLKSTRLRDEQEIKNEIARIEKLENTRKQAIRDAYVKEHLDLAEMARANKQKEHVAELERRQREIAEKNALVQAKLAEKLAFKLAEEKRVQLEEQRHQNMLLKQAKLDQTKAEIDAHMAMKAKEREKMEFDRIMKTVEKEFSTRLKSSNAEEDIYSDFLRSKILESIVHSKMAASKYLAIKQQEEIDNPKVFSSKFEFHYSTKSNSSNVEPVASVPKLKLTSTRPLAILPSVSKLSMFPQQDIDIGDDDCSTIDSDCLSPGKRKNRLLQDIKKSRSINHLIESKNNSLFGHEKEIKKSISKPSSFKSLSCASIAASATTDLSNIKSLSEVNSVDDLDCSKTTGNKLFATNPTTLISKLGKIKNMKKVQVLPCLY